MLEEPESVSFADDIDNAIGVLQATKEALFDARLYHATALLSEAARKKAPILICGNGGSSADAEHMTAELVGKFRIKDRHSINAICLSSNAAVMTAWGNDVGFDAVFARQVFAHANHEDAVLFCISTSGNSDNVVRAAWAARSVGIHVISLTGMTGGRLAELSDILINVPSRDTPLIQQAHQVIYHHLCEAVEANFASKSST
jgi:D-sedoheptulose 7-phosphate isomerase